MNAMLTTKYLRPRLFVMFALTATPLLFLVMILTPQKATAQKEISPTSHTAVTDSVVSQEIQKDLARLPYAADITFSSTYTIYLPGVQKNVSTCSIAPTLLSPPDASQLNTLVPVLEYIRGTTPVSYTAIYIADNLAFNQPLIYSSYGSGLGPRQLRLFDNLQAATTYYWRVKDVCGSVNSPYSPIFSFTTGSGGVILLPPTLVSPANGTSGVGQQETLTWNSVSGAVGYQVRVCIGGCILYYSPTTSQVVYFLLPDMTYTWYVRAYNDYAYGDSSVQWQFTTGTFFSRQEWVKDFQSWDTNIYYPDDQSESIVQR